MTEVRTIGFILVETPLHCGSGQEIGIVDQPIQREKHTNYPIIQASEIKGVFRDYYRRKINQYTNEIFGPEDTTDTGGEYASCVSFGDARILFFPVKSLRGVYAWITCEDVLNKFLRTSQLSDSNFQINLGDLKVTSEDEVVVFSNELIVQNNKVVLEDYVFNASQKNLNGLSGLVDVIIPSSNNNHCAYLNQSLKNKLCIVHNNVFKDFVEMSTEVITRIRINPDTGVVKEGALWTEEYLPTDTILYFPIIITEPKKKVNDLSCQRVLDEIKRINLVQIGGNETIGKGFVRITYF